MAKTTNSDATPEPTAAGQASELSLETSAARDKTLPLDPKSTDHKMIAKLRSEIERHGLAAEKHIRSALPHVIDAGNSLLQAKQLIEHGQFGRWLRENFATAFRLSERTANRWMELARFRARLVAHLKARANLPFVSDVPDDKVLEGVSLTQALSLVRYVKKGAETAAEHPKLRTPTASWKQCITPEVVANGLYRALGEFDFAYGEREEREWLRSRTGTFYREVFSVPVKLSGKVFANCLTKNDPTRLLSDLNTAVDRGQVTEAILLVPEGNREPVKELLRGRPRIVFRQRLVVPVTCDNVYSEAPLPIPVMLVHLGSPEVTAQLAASFCDQADVYLPYAQVSAL